MVPICLAIRCARSPRPASRGSRINATSAAAASGGDHSTPSSTPSAQTATRIGRALWVVKTPRSTNQSYAEDFRKPKEERRKEGERTSAADGVVEMAHDEVAVVRRIIDRRRGDHHAGDAPDEKIEQEADGEEHRRRELDRALPHRTDPSCSASARSIAAIRRAPGSMPR